MDNYNICLVTTTLPMNEKMVTMWNKFDEELKKHSYKLCLLATDVNSQCKCDHIKIPSFLYQFADLKLITHRNNIKRSNINQTDMFLREIEWFNLSDDELDKHYLGYLNCVAFYEGIINELKPSIILAWQNNLPQTHILKLLATEYSVPHKIIERGLLPDTLMLENEGIAAQSDILNNFSIRKMIQDYPSEQDYELIKQFYFTNNPTKYDHIVDSKKQNITEYFDASKDPLIVYFTQVDSSGGMYPANTYSSKKMSSVYESTIETIVELQNAADELKFDLIVKLHPGDTKSYDFKDTDRVKVTKEADCKALMEKSQVMIFSGSTLQFEALLYEKPIVLLTASQLSGTHIAYEVISKSDLYNQINKAINKIEFGEKNLKAKSFISWITNYFLFAYTDKTPVKNSLKDLAEHCSWVGVKIDNLTFNEKLNRLEDFLQKIDNKIEYKFSNYPFDPKCDGISREKGNVQHLIKKAKQLISQNSLDDAETILIRILEENKANIDALNDLSVIKLKQNNKIQSLKYIRKVFEYNQDNEIAIENFKILLNNNNNKVSGTEMIANLIQNPAVYLSYFINKKTTKDKKSFDISIYTNGLDELFNDTPLLNGLVEDELAENNLFTAEQILDEIKKNGALIDEKMIEHSKFIRNGREKIKLKKSWTSKEINEVVGKSEELIQANKLIEAEEILMDIVNMNPFFSEAINNLAVIYILKKDYYKAFNFLQTILRHEPNNEIANENFTYLIENDFVDLNSITLKMPSPVEDYLELLGIAIEQDTYCIKEPPKDELMKESQNLRDLYNRFVRENRKLTHAKNDERIKMPKKYLSGRGIEIGAFHSPLPLPKGCEADYVDKVNIETLKKWMPETDKFFCVYPFILDNGEILSKVESKSYDFLVANHMIEHTENVFRTIENHARVVKKGGYIFYAVPDKKYTFDKNRSLTSYEHLKKEYFEGSENNRYEHYREYGEVVNNITDPDEMENYITSQIENNRDIHFHVWNYNTFVEQIELSIKENILDIELVEHKRNGGEFIVLLKVLS